MGKINYQSPFSFQDVNAYLEGLEFTMSSWEKVTIKDMSRTYYHGLSTYSQECDPPYMSEETRLVSEKKKSSSIVNSWVK